MSRCLYNPSRILAITLLLGVISHTFYLSDFPPDTCIYNIVIAFYQMLKGICAHTHARTHVHAHTHTHTHARMHTHTRTHTHTHTHTHAHAHTHAHIHYSLDAVPAELELFENNSLLIQLQILYSLSTV